MKSPSLLCWVKTHIHHIGTCISVTTHPHIEDTAGISDSLAVGLGISATTANVEADTDHIQPKFLGSLQKTSTSFEWGSKLHTQATHCL